MEILLHTPKWVFALFFFLLYLGIIQIKDRKLSKTRLLIMPIAMICLAVITTFSNFELSFLNILFYILGLAFGMFLNKLLKFPPILKLEDGFFIAKGSFHYLILIMCIFFTKYFLGAVSAVNPKLLLQNSFIISMLILFGIYAGIFFKRIISVLKY